MNTQNEGNPPTQRRIRSMVLSAEFGAADNQLVAAALHMAGADWSGEDDSAARASFEAALIRMMAEAAPGVPVVAYGDGATPVDHAYRKLQRQALYRAYARYHNGYETANDVADANISSDLFDEAFLGYIVAAERAAANT